MAYSNESLAKIEKTFQELQFSHNSLFLKLLSFNQKLMNDKSREYLMQGVGRRLKIIFQCIDNIFLIFPPKRTKHLSSKELADISINLHAFFINIAGIFDNLGWVFIHERNLLGKAKGGKVSRNGVGLFCSETQAHLALDFANYLNSKPISTWYNNYSKNYRDSLAHRIPLYVPPSLLNDDDSKKYQDIEEKIEKLDFSEASDRVLYDKLREEQQNLGSVSHFFAHSLNEAGAPVYFHAQVLADYATVEEIFDKFCTHYE